MTQISDAPRIRNGVNVDTMFGTLDAIKANPALATFQWRASSQWLGGSHNRSTIKVFYAAGGDDTTRQHSFSLDAGEPAILLGHDEGRTRPSSCSMRSLPASPRRSSTSARPARSTLSPSSRQSRATWTSRARSASTTRCGTGSPTSASTSRSKPTPRARRSRSVCSAHTPALLSSTASRRACRSTSDW